MKEPIRVKMAQRNTPDAMIAFREYRSPANADIEKVMRTNMETNLTAGNQLKLLLMAVPVFFYLANYFNDKKKFI
jgi:hypothetical protein